MVNAAMNDQAFREALARASIRPAGGPAQAIDGLLAGRLASRTPQGIAGGGSNAGSQQAQSSAAVTSSPSSRQTSSGVGRTFEIDIGNGKTATVTTTAPAEIGAVCGGGRKLWQGGISLHEYRVFDCDGTGSYVNACRDGENSGTFKWGFVLLPPDKTRLNVKSYAEWGWGQPTANKAAEIVMRFEGGCAEGNVYGGIIGVNNGKVVQGFGYGFAEK